MDWIFGKATKITGIWVRWREDNCPLWSIFSALYYVIHLAVKKAYVHFQMKKLRFRKIKLFSQSYIARTISIQIWKKKIHVHLHPKFILFPLKILYVRSLYMLQENGVWEDGHIPGLLRVPGMSHQVRVFGFTKEITGKKQTYLFTPSIDRAWAVSEDERPRVLRC